MDPVHHLPAPDADDVALTEVDVAIGLVAAGLAVRVRLVGLPVTERIAGVAVARGQTVGVLVHLDRTGASPGLTIGPRR